MSAIIPFQFETHAIRTVIDENGGLWFVGKDVASVLGYVDTVNALKQHCKGVVKRHPIQDSLGRQQEVRLISEPDLFRLVVNSKLPSAERFEHWVFEEVLPSIRKTGRYAFPKPSGVLPEPIQDRVSAIRRLGDWIAKVPGVRPGIAAAMTLDCIEGNTDIDPGAMRHALPPANEPMCTLNATQLGTHLKLSARATNQLLATVGFQRRNQRNEWELTKAGEVWAQALPFARNSHSGYQILWNPAVAEQLQQAA